jgi:hypothetical protein
MHCGSGAAADVEPFQRVADSLRSEVARSGSRRLGEAFTLSGFLAE